MLVNEVGCIENDQWKGGQVLNWFLQKIHKSQMISTKVCLYQQEYSCALGCLVIQTLKPVFLLFFV